MANLVVLVLLVCASTTSGFLLNHHSPLDRHNGIRSRCPAFATMQDKPFGRAESDSNFQLQPSTFPVSLSFHSLVLLAPTAAFAAGPEWLEPTRVTLDIALALFSTLFFIRIPMTWYPQMDLNQFPQNLAAW